MANFFRKFEPWLLRLHNSEIYTCMRQAWVQIEGKALSLKQESQSCWDSGSLRFLLNFVWLPRVLWKKRENPVFWLMRGITSSRWHKSQISVLRRSLALQMCCSQFAGADKEFQHPPLTGRFTSPCPGHLSDMTTMKVSQGWLRPCLCLSGCAFHCSTAAQPGAQGQGAKILPQTAVVALTPLSYKTTLCSFWWGLKRPWMKPQWRSNSPQSKGVPQRSLFVESLHCH